MVVVLLVLSVVDDVGGGRRRGRAPAAVGVGDDANEVSLVFSVTGRVVHVVGPGGGFVVARTCRRCRGGGTGWGLTSITSLSILITPSWADSEDNVSRPPISSSLEMY